MDKQTISIPLNNGIDTAYFEVEAETDSGFAIHPAVVGFYIPELTADWRVTHINTGCSCGPDMEYDQALKIVEKLKKVSVGGVPLGKLSRCDAINLLPLIRKEIKKVNLITTEITADQLFEHQRHLADALDCVVAIVVKDKP